MGSIDISPVPESEKPQLWEALQSYLAELSTLGGRAAVNGVVSYQYFDAYWQEPVRWPWWIKSDGQVAGFALVRKRDDGIFEMAEFYIQPGYRRSGLGAAIAGKLFALYPGRWHLSEFKQNLPAIAFWRRVAQGHAGYEETISSARVEQSFDTRSAK